MFYTVSAKYSKCAVVKYLCTRAITEGTLFYFNLQFYYTYSDNVHDSNLQMYPSTVYMLIIHSSVEICISNSVFEKKILFFLSDNSLI